MERRVTDEAAWPILIPALRYATLISWILTPEHNALITWIGFAIGVVGTVLGLAGIAITLSQLKAIKSETEASAAAIRSVQFKVASFDVAQECIKALAIVVQIRNSLKKSSWTDVISEYETLIQHLINISYASTCLVDDDRKLIVKYTDDMAKMCEAIRRRSADPEQSFVLRGQDRALRNFADLITRMSFSVARSLQQ